MIKIDPRFDQKRRLAAAILGQRQATPTQGNAHWSSGLANALASAYGTRMLVNADRDEQKYRDDAMATLKSALNPDPVQVGEEHGPTLEPKTSRYEHLINTLSSNPATAESALNMQFEIALESAKKGKTGAFEGTGIEAQMLNIMLDPSIPDTDPRKHLARQRLSRPQTVVTPDATFTYPGYSFNSDQGSGAQSGVPTQSVQPPTVTPKKKTDGEKLSSGFYKRMKASQREIDSLGGFNPATFRESVTGLMNTTRSKKNQRFRQAANDWIRAKLRKESGAVIGDEEMQSEYETYFPVFGDSDEVIEQKRRARKVAEAAMRESAGIKDSGVDTSGWSVRPK